MVSQFFRYLLTICIKCSEFGDFLKLHGLCFDVSFAFSIPASSLQSSPHTCTDLPIMHCFTPLTDQTSLVLRTSTCPVFGPWISGLTAACLSLMVSVRSGVLSRSLKGNNFRISWRLKRLKNKMGGGPAGIWLAKKRGGVAAVGPLGSALMWCSCRRREAAAGWGWGEVRRRMKS